jgi:uncharacterized Zn-finger protein
MNSNELTTPCEKRHFEILEQDLPLRCPLPSMRLWDGHPAVYLPIEDTGHEICPYCGTEYTLKGFVKTNKE